MTKCGGNVEQLPPAPEPAEEEEAKVGASVPPTPLCASMASVVRIPRPINVDRVWHCTFLCLGKWFRAASQQTVGTVAEDGEEAGEEVHRAFPSICDANALRVVLPPGSHG